MWESSFLGMIVAILIISAVIYSCYHTGNSYDKFKKDGIKAEAKVLSKVKIGATDTGNTKFRMELEFVTKDGLVKVTEKRYLTPEDLIKVMRKDTIELYYLPKDPKKVFLVPNEME